MPNPGTKHPKETVTHTPALGLMSRTAPYSDGARTGEERGRELRGFGSEPRPSLDSAPATAPRPETRPSRGGPAAAVGVTPALCFSRRHEFVE